MLYGLRRNSIALLVLLCLLLQIALGAVVTEPVVLLKGDERAATAVAILTSPTTGTQPNPVADANTIARPLSPSIIAGQGADPQNHTIVRIFEKTKQSPLQFLAYGPHVRGGVQVEAGKNSKDLTTIVCAPMNDPTIKELHVFNTHGTQIDAWQPKLRDNEIPPPYCISIGNFDIGQKGDEVAVVSRDKGQVIGIFNLQGKNLYAITFTERPTHLNTLSSCHQGKRDRLICLAKPGHRLWEITPMSQTINLVNLDPNLHITGAHGSSINHGRLLGTSTTSQETLLYQFTALDPNVTAIDLAQFHVSDPHNHTPNQSSQIRAYITTEKTFDVIALGFQTSPTVLKSIFADGSNEGSIDITPFDTSIDVVTIPSRTTVTAKGIDITFGPLKHLKPGTTIEINFQAKSTRRNWLRQIRSAPVTIQAMQDGTPIKELSWTLQAPSKFKPARFILQIQKPTDSLELNLKTHEEVEIKNLTATRQSPLPTQAQNPPQQVTFDILP